MSLQGMGHKGFWPALVWGMGMLLSVALQVAAQEPDAGAKPPQPTAVALVAMSTAELQAGSGGRVVYTVRTHERGELGIDILTADGDLVRRLRRPEAPAGTHELTWDGTDDKGQPVPDEAYCARAIMRTAQSTSEDNPCQRTGGEVITGISPSMGGVSDIVYTLSHPARVLIRVGIRQGAMLRSLSVWRPRGAGRNVQRWNGFDESGLVDLRNDRLAILVSAFRLPDFTVIVTGQAQSDYRDWRLMQGWTESTDAAPAERAALPLERNGQRIARQHHTARYKDREPRISVALSSRDGKPLKPGEPPPREVRVNVDLHPDDRWLLQEQLYEVAFFVNGDFVSEEENGYVPIGWIWNTDALPPGRHLLTVNLTGFSGRVGVHTVAIDKP